MNEPKDSIKHAPQIELGGETPPGVQAEIHSLFCENQSPLEDVVVRLPCYEPAGRRLVFSAEALCRNMLMTGTVGSGKTSALKQILRDLILYRAEDSERKIGLLVFDFKCDETPATVLGLAKESGREADVVWLHGASPTHYLGLLEGLRSPEDIDELTEQIATASDCGGDNAYWDKAVRKRIQTALTLLYFSSPDGFGFQAVVRLFQGLYLSGVISEEVQALCASLREWLLCVRGRMPLGWAMRVETALACVNEWENLDAKTKSNETSVLSNGCAALFGGSAVDFMESSRREPVDFRKCAAEGKIVVFSVNAAINPGLALTLGRLVKARFYRSLQSRNPRYHDRDRLVGMIADEYPLVATGGSGTYSDLVQLQTLRAKRAFVIAATQGLVSLDNVIGQQRRRTLQINFNTWFFFRSNEPELDVNAAVMMGFQPEGGTDTVDPEQFCMDQGGLCKIDHAPVRRAQRAEPVCPLGSLHCLNVGEAYVSFSQASDDKNGRFWLVEGHLPATERPAEAACQPSALATLGDLYRATEPASGAADGLDGETTIPMERPLGEPLTADDWEKLAEMDASARCDHDGSKRKRQRRP